MQLLRAFPSVRIVSPFLGGVVAGAFLLEYLTVSFEALFGLAALWSAIFGLAGAVHFRRRGQGMFGPLALLSCILGGILLVFSVSGQLYPGHLLHGAHEGPQILILTVRGETQDKPNSVKVEADALTEDGTRFGRVLLYLQRDSLMPPIGHGDRLAAHVQLSEVRQAGNPNEFNYARYLRFHHIHHQAYVPRDRWTVLESDARSVRRFFIGLRRDLMGVFRRAGLEGDDLAVASALVLGYKADLEQSLVQSYAGAGATHVLAVSGLHVGIIYLVINALLRFLTFLPHGERVRAGLTVAILVGYALLTGLSPSVTRSVTMFSFVAVAKSIQRTGSIYNTLACSALALILYDPLIVMQVGFQLSYAAVLGIVIFQPWLFSQFSIRNRFFDKVWEITCVSMAAQLATFPLGLLYFHQFPNLFFLSNLVVIPAATAVLIIGLISFVAQVWMPALAFTGLLLNWVIGGMNIFVAWIDKVPYAVASGIDITVPETIIIYMLICCAAWMFINREVRMAVPVLGLGLLLVLTQTHEFGQQQRQQSLTVYSIRKETAIGVMDGTRMQFIASPELLENEQSLLFHVRHHWWAQGVKEEIHMPLTDTLTNRPFHWNGHSIIILSRPSEGAVLHVPDSLDVAIVHSVSWRDIPALAARMPPTVVLSSALGQRTSERLRDAIPHGIAVWDVGRQGAFSLRSVPDGAPTLYAGRAAGRESPPRAP